MAADISTKVPEGLTPQSDLRLVLLGKVGAEKGMVAGHILGQGNWKDRGMCVKKQGEVAGRTVTVVRTPGWDRVSVKCTSSQIKKEIANSVTLVPPGPHALLLVVPLGEEMSSDEKKSVHDHMELLSDRVWKQTMLLFVSQTKEGDEFIPSESTKDLLEKCGGRYHVLCGHSSNRTKVSELLQKIEAMVEDNADEFFLPQVYYELMERKRETSEDQEKKIRQSYELQITQIKDELNPCQSSQTKELRKRRSSLNVPPQLSTEEQKTSDDRGFQKVEHEPAKDGSKEAWVAIMTNYCSPISLIICGNIGGFFGAIAGAQYGPMGSFLGIFCGSAAGVLACFGFRAAFKKTTNIPKSKPDTQCEVTQINANK